MLHHKQKMFPSGFCEGKLYNCNYQEAPRISTIPLGTHEKMVLFNKSIPGTLVSKVFTVDIAGVKVSQGTSSVDHSTFPYKI